MKRTAWTLERRAKQLAVIMRTRPWERSTGPRTQEGKAIVSKNARQPGSRRERAQVREALRKQLAVLGDIKAGTLR